MDENLRKLTDFEYLEDENVFFSIFLNKNILYIYINI